LSTYAIEFEYASSDPTAGSNGRLEALARMLVSTPQSVEIRGVATSLADAELAWQRAQAVAKVLVEQAELEPSRLRLTVSGTSGKVATTGPAGLLEKSMVEVVLLGEPAVDVAARPAPLR
jgi:flagellar motor protein MotB